MSTSRTPLRHCQFERETRDKTQPMTVKHSQGIIPGRLRNYTARVERSEKEPKYATRAGRCEKELPYQMLSPRKPTITPLIPM